MVSFRMVFIVALVFTGPVTSIPENVTIVGLFDGSNDVEEAVFHYAVEQINQQSNLLPGSRVTGWTERVNFDDSFHTSKKVCEFLGHGVAAVVSPNSPNSAPEVRSICQAKEVPHIEVGMVVDGSSSINLFPHPSSLAKAFSSVVAAMGWKEYVILYEDIRRLTYMQELLVTKDMKVTVRKLDRGPNGTLNDYRSLLEEIKFGGHKQIILDCSSANIHQILSHALQVGMMTEYQSYLITNLDLHTVDLEDFKHGGARITGLRLGNSDKETLQINFPKQLQDKIPNVTPMKTEAAVMYDGLLLWAKALTSLGEFKNIEGSPLDCQTESFLEYGSSLINLMKLEETVGLTGRIKLNDFGFRTDFDLEIVELKNTGLRTVGNWDPLNGAQFFTLINKRDTGSHEKELLISTILSEPFVMLKEVPQPCMGSFLECYEGYSIDLLKKLSKEVKFKFTIKLVSDGKYGQYDEKTQQWSGMIGELQSQKADLAIADMVITSERAKVIDFTTPFMKAGITILYKKEYRDYSRGLFTYITSPFGLDLWLCILAAYFAVSLVLFILTRFNPLEINSKSTVENAEESSSSSKDPVHSADGKEVFTAMNSFWFILSSGLAQRVDFLPRSFSTRVIAVFWWLFVMVTICSYIANLVVFFNFNPPLTEKEKIQDVWALAEQNRVKYGTVQGGSTEAFFRDSNVYIYDKIWASMNNNEGMFVKSAKAGIERVSKEDGKYAFFAESPLVDYVVERHCDLKQVGGLLDEKSYGIGLPKNSPYYEQINRGLLGLQERGVLDELKNKWWKWERGGGFGGRCITMEYEQRPGITRLSGQDLGGIFVLLLVGILLACVIACGECLVVWWRKRQDHEG